MVVFSSSFVSYVFRDQFLFDFDFSTLLQDYLLWTERGARNGIHIVRMDNMDKIRQLIHPKTGIASDLISFDAQNQPTYSPARLYTLLISAKIIFIVRLLNFKLSSTLIYFMRAYLSDTVTIFFMKVGNDCYHKTVNTSVDYMPTISDRFISKRIQ